MVKYDNLDWQARNHLGELYDQAHPKPEDLPKYEDPAVGSPLVLMADGETRIFLEVAGRKYVDHEAMVRIVIQTGKEVYRAEMVIEEAQKFRDELEDVIVDVDAVNTERVEYRQRAKDRRAAQTAWEAEKGQALRKLLADGKITTPEIENAEKWADLVK